MEKCEGCKLPKDCEDCFIPTNVELGQMIYANNTIYEYDCPEWIIALLQSLDYELGIAMWNVYQKEYDSPFMNTGNEFIGKNFEVHAYNWNEDVEQEYNFKCGDIEISWYKYLGRGTTINNIYDTDYIIQMYNMCLEEIRSLDEDICEW